MDPASSTPPAVVVDEGEAAPAAAPAALAVLAVAPRARAAALPSRATVAKVLFVLGCATVALALFGMTLNPADPAGFLGPCKPTDEEAADLRSASMKLLLAAATQVLGATVAVVVPEQPFAVCAAVLGALTGMRVSFFLPALLMCHLEGAATVFSYGMFIGMLLLTLCVSIVAAVSGSL